MEREARRDAALHRDDARAVSARRGGARCDREGAHGTARTLRGERAHDRADARGVRGRARRRTSYGDGAAQSRVEIRADVPAHPRIVVAHGAARDVPSRRHDSAARAPRRTDGRRRDGIRIAHRGSARRGQRSGGRRGLTLRHRGRARGRHRRRPGLAHLRAQSQAAPPHRHRETRQRNRRRLRRWLGVAKGRSRMASGHARSRHARSDTRAEDRAPAAVHSAMHAGIAMHKEERVRPPPPSAATCSSGTASP